MDESIRSLFSPAPGTTYLNSATYGLPPEPTVGALEQALGAWREGTASWITDWDLPAEQTRSSLGRILGVESERIALIPAASVGVGTVVSRLGPGDEIVVPDDEFTSVLYPLLVAEEQGATVRQVAFDGLVDAIAPGTTLVATSLVQMQTGRVIDVEAIIAKTGSVGAQLLVDATQGTPFVPLADHMDRIDYLVTAAYKHLLCPRGVAFLVVRSDRLDEIVPWNANWRATPDPYGTYFGGPLTLADSTARLDVSLAWLPWVGAIESLRLLAEWNESGALAEPLQLARDFAGALGIEWGGSSLVCVPVENAERTMANLKDAGVQAAPRGNSIRFSTHVYNDNADIERALAALGPDGRVPSP